MKTEINGYFCQKQLAYRYQTGKLPLEKKKTDTNIQKSHHIHIITERKTQKLILTTTK